MFTGIVSAVGSIRAVDMVANGGRIVVATPWGDDEEIGIGESIAVDGVCLTVVARAFGALTFDLASETVRCTTFGDLFVEGARWERAVHLERALAVGDRMSGHFVTGHVDAITVLCSREDSAASSRLTFSLPKNAHPGLIVPKGSVTLAGTSLTVGEVSDGEFSVYIVPHTARVTCFGTLRVGDRVNIEYDVIARYAVASIAAYRGHRDEQSRPVESV